MRYRRDSLAHYHPLLQLLFLALLATATAAAVSKPKNAILLSDVQTLTLRANKPTSHRRVSAIPQLKCVSPSKICALHQIDILRCTNQGHSYSEQDIEWACTAALPSTLKLGSTEVICEGYSSPDDPYILRGSCGVEYRLALTEEGERVYPELAGGSSWGFKTEEGEADWAGYVFAVLFFGVLAWIVWGACTAAAGGNRAAGGRGRRPGGGGPGGGWGGGWGGGGGGGGGAWDDAPPPYPGTKPSTSGDGWRPGFWSGLAGGAAAGYMAGNRGGRDDRRYNQGGGGLWGGRNSGGGWASGSGSQSPGSSSSGARHESTGFGSTSRR